MRRHGEGICFPGLAVAGQLKQHGCAVLLLIFIQGRGPAGG